MEESARALAFLRCGLKLGWRRSKLGRNETRLVISRVRYNVAVCKRSGAALAEGSTTNEVGASEESSVETDLWLAIITGVVLLVIGGVLTCFRKTARACCETTLARLRGIDGASSRPPHDHHEHQASPAAAAIGQDM